MPYRACDVLQRKRLEGVLQGEPSTLLFVEHDPVITLGAGYKQGNLLESEAEYRARGIEVVPIDRGGDVTYHGPGQLVIYPIFDTTVSGRDLHRWLRDLEETMIRVCGSFGVEGRRFPPHTGVWVGDRKIAAIGIKIRRWVSMHGIALNCDADLAPFQWIIPCGIRGYGVTSLSNEAGRPIAVEEAKPAVAAAFEEVFGLTFG
jgi:lipoate-protein ligase B